MPDLTGAVGKAGTAFSDAAEGTPQEEEVVYQEMQHEGGPFLQGAPKAGFGNLNAPEGYQWTDTWNETIPGKRYIPELSAPLTQGDLYKQLPGYEKLTSTERWMAETLPGKVQKWDEKLRAFLPDPIEGAVYKYGGAAFKLFADVLSVGSNFVERGSGLVAQYKDALENDTVDEFTSNLQDAWFAGSMFHDVANYPQFDTDEDGTLRAMWMHDLPGQSHLTELRRQITELTDAGMPVGDARDLVRDAYNQSLGALSIRAAKQDMMGHILGDPFIIAGSMGYKPVDIVKNIANAASISKYPVGYLDDMKMAMEVAEQAGKTDEVARLAKEIEIMEKAMKPYNLEDKIAMFLTGQFPEPAADAGKAAKFLYGAGNTMSESTHPVMKLFRKLNPFSLTPQARAHEWITRIDDYISTHILSQATPEQIVDEFVKLASQATTGQLSAIGATADGKLIQAALRGAEVNAVQALNDFRRLKPYGDLLEFIAAKMRQVAPDLKTTSVLDDIVAGKTDDIVRTLQQIGDDESIRLIEALTDKRTLDILKDLKGKPFREDLFRIKLHADIADDIARQGIMKFGVKSRGLLQKWTAFMKAGETMFFLRMNPTFAARNWINNEITMIARGVGGNVFGDGVEALAKVVDDLGFTPMRAVEAFTPAALEGAEDLTTAGQKVGQAMGDALRGDVNILDKAANWINSRKLPLDFGEISRGIEAAASRKAFAKGYTRAFQKYWKPGGFTSAASFLPEGVIAELGEASVKQLDDMLQSARNLDDVQNILGNFESIDLAKSTAGVVNRVESKLGIDLSQQFSDENLLLINDTLQQALKAESPADARKLFDTLFKNQIKGIEEEAAKRLDTYVEAFKNATYSQRGGALVDLTEEITNQLDVFEYLYSTGMARFRPSDLSADVRKLLWPEWLDEQTRFWKVKNDRIDSIIDGIVQGSDDLGLDLTQALKKVQNKRNVWDGFFDWRNAEYDKFFSGADDAFKSWEDLVEAVNTRYITAAETDLAILKEIDDIMTDAYRILNPDLAEGYAGYRQAIREWKIRDRGQTRTYAYQQKLGELPIDSPTYAEFWRNRSQLQLELEQIKQAGRAMMEGDEQALRYFQSILADTEPGSVANVSKKIAEDLAGEVTPARGMEAMDSGLGPMFQNEAAEEQWFSRNFWTLKELEDEAVNTLKTPESVLDLSDEAKDYVGRWLNNARREMADAQYASIRFGEYSRDAALLNYNRTLNYDTWLGTFMPYEFWMTHSMMQWAIQSLNRPAMMQFYLRSKEMMDRIALDTNMPTRLQDKMKIHLPFLPDWMGDDIYVDPFQVLLPFNQMTMPLQKVMQRGASRQGAVERELGRMVADGQITQEEADTAIAQQSGQLFNAALERAMQQDGADGYELLSALSSIHAPYDYAIKALKGEPESIGPFLPATYTATRLLGMFGVDWAHSDLNAPARIRRAMGLPGFDQWEDYRVERMLSNLSATGDITPDEANRAMITHTGPAWEMAREKAAKEFAGGPWWATLLKSLGAPMYIYPEGEKIQRQLSEDFGQAIEDYENGDFNAYNRFWDKYPEFSTRLALFKEPNERMQSFLVNDVWDMYSEMSTLDKRITRESLGEDFQLRFLNEGTRNYDSIPLETLHMWAKMMGGDPPGTLSDAAPIIYAPPEVSNQAQTFYDTRNEFFPNYYDLQNKYFDLAEGAPRRSFLTKNPELKRYWDWRRDFLKRNPSIAPYIDDNFQPNYGSVQELEQAYAQEPQYIEEEWENLLGSSGYRLALDAYNGEELPTDIIEYLTEEAESIGITYEELLQRIGSSQ